MPDFRTLAEAAEGPDVWLSIDCTEHLRGGRCWHGVKLSIVYLIATHGPAWKPSRVGFTCSRCGAPRCTYAFGHPKWPFGQGKGEMPVMEYHRRVLEQRWRKYVDPVPLKRHLRARPPAWR